MPVGRLVLSGESCAPAAELQPPTARPPGSLHSVRYRYAIEGDKPPWRPLSAYDDGRKVYIEFPPGIAQGEMPPLFVDWPGRQDRNSSTIAPMAMC